MSYRKSLIVLFTCIIIALGTLNSAKNSKYERYKIEKAKIEYKISGALSGTETLIFDQFGMLEKKETKGTVNQNGMLQQIHVAEYTLIDKYYDMSLLNNVGNEYSLQSLFDHADSLKKTNLLDIQRETMIAAGATIEDGRRILGRVTQKFTTPDSKFAFWSWKNVTLKIVKSTPIGDITVEAVEIDENPKIDKSVFTLPKNVKIEKR